MSKNQSDSIQQITNRTHTNVRFSEVDALGIVWHGHYIKFFEDGREAFGKQFGLSYLDVYKLDFLTPIVNINVDYKKTVMYGDSVFIDTTFVDSPAAKIIFQYLIFRQSDNELAASGQSTQVFVNKQHQLCITIPPFFEEWKKKNGIL